VALSAWPFRAPRFLIAQLCCEVSACRFERRGSIVEPGQDVGEPAIQPFAEQGDAFRDRADVCRPSFQIYAQFLLTVFELVQPDIDAGDPPIKAIHPLIEAGHPSIKAIHPLIEAGHPSIEAFHPPAKAVDLPFNSVHPFVRHR
jgi:hypothetical protein